MIHALAQSIHHAALVQFIAQARQKSAPRGLSLPS
jgi:hypothetical protein